jgi:hypothetical protein
MENPRREVTGSSTYVDRDRWSEVKTAAVIGGMVVFWAMAAAVLGQGAGFTVSLLVVLVTSTVHWREHLTPAVLAKIALYGVPAAILALYWW